MRRFCLRCCRRWEEAGIYGLSDGLTRAHTRGTPPYHTTGLSLKPTRPFHNFSLPFFPTSVNTISHDFFPLKGRSWSQDFCPLFADEFQFFNGVMQDNTKKIVQVIILSIASHKKWYYKHCIYPTHK